jgi:hypothetical protein
MPAHKYILGQKVRFSPDRGQFIANRNESFIVVRLLPSTEDALQYHLKSLADGHLRLAREDQLADL